MGRFVAAGGRVKTSAYSQMERLSISIPLPQMAWLRVEADSSGREPRRAAAADQSTGLRKPGTDGETTSAASQVRERLPTAALDEPGMERLRGDFL